MQNNVTPTNEKYILSINIEINRKGIKPSMEKINEIKV